MQSLSTAELRQKFLNFFAEHGHTKVKSSSLVPGNDATLLFTNAGMVQFKDVFLGQEKRDYSRATTSQRCVRAGGKHNDLENVGYTARHHTFFEMLGNFSFGDYFKKEAIHFAWDFLTKELGLPADRLWVTVFEEDDEAESIWLNEIGIPVNRCSRIGAKDNFWSMGDTGPCGPCSEIFYDHGAHVPGGPPGTPEEDGDRYIEIWNLVFMQYNQSADGKRVPLPKPSVDTGMGMERLAAVLQGVHENYEIDLFQNLMRAVQQQTGHEELMASSHKVIADHIRSAAFMIVDGVIPANEGRGYVLRRIIRRAIRHAYKLGVNQPFFYKLVTALVAEMGEAYPELTAAQSDVEAQLLREEKRFAETLENGMKLLEGALRGLSGGALIPGDVVFKLYDTYGFPYDLTADIARERGLVIDEKGYAAAMGAQQARSKAGSQFAVNYNNSISYDGTSLFEGYDDTSGSGSIDAIFVDGHSVTSAKAGDDAVVMLSNTPFYAEGGGQVGDSGRLTGPAGRFQVRDTQKQGGSAHAHIGAVTVGSLEVGQKIQAEVDAEARAATQGNHSATHLLHAALRDQLGAHVQQKGSLVNPARLRFDFSHPQPVTPAELASIERAVNEEIRLNSQASAQLMSFDEAVGAGAMALFGEKYGDEVRVLQLGGTSTELCGGTHVRATGDIGLFRIVNETGVASGIRRIEAVTGLAALDKLAADDNALISAAQLLKSNRDEVLSKLEQLLQKNRSLEKDLAKLQSKLASNQGNELTAQAVEVGGIKVLAALLEGIEPKQLRDTVDQLKQKLGTAAVVVGTVAGGKVSLAAGVTADATNRIKAGDLVNHVATQVGGKGGGRPDMAMAGGTEPDKLAEALASVEAWVELQLG